MKYRFDGEEMLATAKVVLAINPSARDHFDNDPKWLVEDMKQKARVNFQKPAGYLSIYGYVLSAFECPETDEIGIKASLSTYTVGKHCQIAGAQ